MAEAPDPPVDLAEVQREVDACVASEQALVDFVEHLDGVDPRAPSRLPDWTVGHVMTHIARNGDGVLSVLSGQAQYPHGVKGRIRDIAVGATRDWSALVADVRAVGAAVEAALVGRDDWTGTVPMLAGERRTSQVPLLRQRELEVHRVDLGLGYDFSDMPGDYVRRELRVMGMLWTARQPMGLTSLPRAARSADPSTRLAWMMGRVDIAGLEPAGLL